jgi:hypothetical protein
MVGGTMLKAILLQIAKVAVFSKPQHLGFSLLRLAGKMAGKEGFEFFGFRIFERRSISLGSRFGLNRWSPK